MSREIKFRAWDFVNKEMIDWEGITSHSDTMYSVLVERLRCDVMQYTGLKDKNGTEIYEGDVINSKGNIVEFSFGCFNINGDRPVYATNCEVIGNIYENNELL